MSHNKILFHKEVNKKEKLLQLKIYRNKAEKNKWKSKSKNIDEDYDPVLSKNELQVSK